MRTKAEELADFLQRISIFYVNIERPAKKGSTVETTIVDKSGISCSVEKNIMTFRGKEKAASFKILKNAVVIINEINKNMVITTFAKNGGLQIKSTSYNYF